MTGSLPIHLVFMLEEESAKHFLEVVLPKILPPVISYELIPHQGKSDLQKSIPRKLTAKTRPNSFFVILHDLDANPDCIALKNELRLLCAPARQHTPLIRIISWELEAWYFGDLDAVEKTFPRFRADRHKRKPRYRYPDRIVKPGEILQHIVKGFHKSTAAREVPKYMDIDNNTSTSFNNTISGIKNLLETQLSTQGQ